MKKIKFIIAALIFSISANSQVNRLWATYYGGSGIDATDGTKCVAVDAAGNVYMSGQTGSTVGIASSGFQNSHGGGVVDAFLVKFNSSGIRQWATYYGGTGQDYPRGLAVDAFGNVYLSGVTNSNANIASGGFQNIFGGGNDAFLVKFDQTGNRIWATYYGGSGAEDTGGIKIDGSGNIYLTGNTTSTNSIASGGFQNTYGGGASDNFVVKFNSAGSRIWATYYGGNGDEQSRCNITSDPSDNVFLASTTTSTANIASTGFQNIYGGGSFDSYLVKFDPSGNRIWATYYGGPLMEFGYSTASDPSGNIYLLGITQSTVNISSGGYQNAYGGGTFNAFLVKFNNSGARQWATYYGGSIDERGHDVVTDPSGDVYLIGEANNATGIASGGFQNVYAGGTDAMLVHFNTNGVRLSATYYGGTAADVGYSGAIDGSGNFYLCGYGSSLSAIASGGYQNTYGGGVFDGYLVKFTTCSGGPNQPTSINGLNSICTGAGATTYSIATVAGATSYTWSLPGGWSGTSATNTISATPGSTGIFTVTASNACGTSPQQTLNVTVNSLPVVSVNSGSICAGNSFTIVPIGANTYTIQGGSSVVSPTTTSSYTVTGTSIAGCVSSNTAIASVTVNSVPVANASTTQTLTCVNATATLNGSGVSTYTWSGPGIVSGGNSSTPTANMVGTYSLVGTTSGCVSNTATVSLTSNTTAPTVSVTATSNSICIGNSATLTVSGANTYSWSTTSTATSIVVSPTTTTNYIVTGTNTVNGCTNSTNKSIGVNPLPVVTANTSNTIICGPPYQGTATITASGASTYTWNTTATTTAITVSPSVTTVYTVTGTDANGCVNSTSFTQSVSACTGIISTGIVMSSEVETYPNPANETLNIDLPNFNNSVDIKIVNAIGQTVLDDKLTTQHSSFNIQHFPSGIYFVRIGSVTRKIIKQ